MDKGEIYVLQNEENIIELIENDPWMMDILKTVQKLELPDAWVCAGFIRSKIWDTLHDFSVRTKLNDIDVIYYDPSNIEEEQEKKYERILNGFDSTLPWSVKNQARMHVLNNFIPYTSSTDGIAHFPETVTALGVRLDEQQKLLLAAPYGVRDVLEMEVFPTPAFQESLKQIYLDRVTRKNWPARWRKVKIFR